MCNLIFTSFNAIAFSIFLFLQYRFSNCRLALFLESPDDSALDTTLSSKVSL